MRVITCKQIRPHHEQSNGAACFRHAWQIAHIFENAVFGAGMIKPAVWVIDGRFNLHETAERFAWAIGITVDQQADHVDDIAI